MQSKFLRGWIDRFLMAGFVALLLLASPVLAQDKAGPIAGPTSWADYPVEHGFLLELERRRMGIMTRGEPALARLERIAHDYVYADSSQGYSNKQLLRRMKADGLTLVETFQDVDGTAAMVVRDDRTGRHTIAFRGTDDQVMENIANLGETYHDKPVGFAQYKEHAAIWDAWARKYSADGKLTVTGHSRGGGLAALFTASHADKIEELAMFQSPGQTLQDHKDFREVVGKWPKTTLVVAASDVVQLSGQRHIGNPKVIVGLANNMGLSALGGHTSFLIQNPWMTDWKDNPYRDPNDELLLAEMAYHAYASLRIWASPNAAKAQTEWDAFVALYGQETNLPNYQSVVATVDLLAHAKAGYDSLKQEILNQNQAVLAKAGEGDLRPPPDLFDHLLPTEYHGFEDTFFDIYEKLIEQDFQRVESGELRTSEFSLDAVARGVIRKHSVRTYLAALKNAYEGDLNSLRIAAGAAYGLDGMAVSTMWSGPLAKAAVRFSGTSAVPDTALRTGIVKQYYSLQKDALIVFGDMMEAGSKLVEARVAEAATGIAEIAVSIEQYLLNAANRQAVNAQALNPPSPVGSGGQAQQQAAATIVQVQNNGASGASWQPISRAYEEIHEDLFAGAITFGQYQLQVADWQVVAQDFWDAVYYWVPTGDNEGRIRMAAERTRFDAEIAAIDASFATQTENRLAKLNLLLTRFRGASAPEVLVQLQAEAARFETQISAISAGAPDWFETDGTSKGTGEGFLAGKAPAGVAPAMAWLGDTAQLGDRLAQQTLDAFEALSDVIDAAAPKLEREQDYILGVVDFYVFEMQRHDQVIAFSAHKGLGYYPSGQELSQQAYAKWLIPLGAVMDRLLDLQGQLDENGRNAQDFGHIATERSTEIAYFGAAFQALAQEEQRLLQSYSAIAAAMQQGSSNARKPIQPEWGLGRVYDYAGPLLTFNGQTLCVEAFNCDGDLDTEDYLNQIGERLRLWRLPPGDTRDNQPSSEVALGRLWAYIPEHQRLAAQFGATELEVQSKVEQIAPLHAEFLAIVSWRKQLETSFKAQIAGKPILQRAFSGTQPFTIWDDVTPVIKPNSSARGNLPAAYALSVETATAWGELHVDFTFLTARLAYLQTSFLPKVGRLISDISDIEARLRADVVWRLAEMRRLTQEIKANPDMPPLLRAEKLDLANKYVNFALGTHHGVAALAPFRADFASDAQAAYQALTATGEPEMETGRVVGYVRDQNGAPLTTAAIRLNKVVSGGVGPSASMQPGASGQFEINDLQTGWWQIDITAPGFQPFSQTIRVTAFAAGEVAAVLIRDSDTAQGNLAIVIEHEPGTETTPVEVLITDLQGNMVAQGLGPHSLAPGQYRVNSYAQYMETDPASQQFQIFAGVPQTITIAVWQEDDEKDDDPPVDSPVAPPAGKPDFSEAVIALCAPNPVFIRSLYMTILDRDPEQWEIDAHVAQLENGYSRSYYVRGFLLGDGYARLGKQGAAFHTDAIQSILGRAPTPQELSAMPRIRATQVIDDMLASPEHLARTQSCAPLWREDVADTGFDQDQGPDTGTDQPETDVSGDLKQAYEHYIAAYNKLTALMAKGEGDTPAANAAYQAYLQAKAKYEALEAGTGPSTDTEEQPPGLATDGPDHPGTDAGADAGLAHVQGKGVIATDTAWKATTDAPVNEAWMRPGYDDSNWQPVAAQWPRQPAPARSINGMQDTNAEWIWHADDPDLVYFRRAFLLDYLPRSAVLRITADNNYSVYINGAEVGSDGGDHVSVWNTAEQYDILRYLRPGPIVVSVIGVDLGGGSGLLADIAFGGPAILPNAGTGKTAAVNTKGGPTTGVLGGQAAEPSAGGQGMDANPNAAAPNYGGTFLGCYKDANTRDLAGYGESGAAMSTGQCIAACATRGFAYAGTQYATQCFCGDTYGSYGPTGNCDMPCSGAAGEICGGVWANSVYAVDPIEGNSGSGKVVADAKPSASAASLVGQGKDLLSQAQWTANPNVRDSLFAHAFGLFERAQEMGSAEAVYHIGFMYELGNAVPRDNDIALSYYDVAARGGYAEGYAQRIVLLTQLRREDAAAQTFFAYAKAFPDVAMRGFDEHAYSDAVSRAIQQVLKRAGYYNGAIDGIIGRGTRAAIERYLALEMPDEVIQPDPIGGSGVVTADSAGIYTPAHGTAEFSAIMDAARWQIGGDLGQPVIFLVDELRSDGEWVFLQAEPKKPDGSAINYAATQFAAAWQMDMMSDLVMVLLRNENGQMRVVDYVIGPTDVYWYGWVDAYGLPEAFFFPG